MLAILSGRPVEPLVDAERHAHLERMRELTAVRRTSSMPVALLADYALFHLEADLRWLDLTAARVDELRRTILDTPEVPTMIATHRLPTRRHAMAPASRRDRAPVDPKATDLRKRFGQTEALRGIDFALAPGEIVAVMGPSGSGKSTLLHCLAGITVPDEGHVAFQGARIDAMSDAERSRAAADRLRVRLPVRPARPGAPRRSRTWRCHCCSTVSAGDRPSSRPRPGSRVSASTARDRRAGEMSGGQAQRVAIARALVIEPAVIFADEPTGSLDSLAGEHVMELLTRAATEQGAAVVLVTHEAASPPTPTARSSCATVASAGRTRGDPARAPARAQWRPGSGDRPGPDRVRGRDRDRDPAVRPVVPAGPRRPGRTCRVADELHPDPRAGPPRAPTC